MIYKCDQKWPSVDLDRRVLADLDEPDVEIGDERFNLQRSLVGRNDDQLLPGRHHLADSGHRHLLRDAVDRRIELHM